MSLLLHTMLARALEGHAGSRLHWLTQASCACSSGQATLWRGNGLTSAMQQLHTAAALAAPATAQQAPERASGDAAALAVAANSSDSQLQAASSGSNGMLSSLLSGLTSPQLSAEAIGLYYDLDKARVPEAFQPFHQAFYSPRPAKLQRKGGCRGLQAEMALTRSSSLMWRRSSQELLQSVLLAASGGAAAGAAGGAGVPHAYLQGPAGSGKSIALLQMVEWARANGWVVLYVPSAVDLTRGGFFQRRGEDGTFDTLISAQHILKSMADSHAAQLAALSLQLPESRALLQTRAASDALALGASGSSGSDASLAGSSPGSVTAGAPKQASKGKQGGGKGRAASAEGSLMQLVVAGLSTDEHAKLAVECVLALIRELAAAASPAAGQQQQQQPRVLLAVDDYNALYHTSDYGEPVFVDSAAGGPLAYKFRRPVAIEQLSLARSMRLLERTDLGSVRVLVADSRSARVPDSVQVPHPHGTAYVMPRFSEVEVAHALFYYYERGLTAAPPSHRQVAAMRALTNGSGTDLRRWCLKVTQTDVGLL